MLLHVNAIGLRYGIGTEETFRESIRYLVEDLLKEYKVTKWTYRDKEGFVYNKEAIVEVDVLVRDKKHILIEYKASASKGDIIELYRIGVLYERVVGVKPELLMVTTFIRDSVRKLAEDLGIVVKAPSYEELLGSQ